MRRTALLALAILLLLSSCAATPPDGEDAVSVSVTEYVEPESNAPVTEAPPPEVTEPPETINLGEIMTELEPRSIVEISERFSEIYRSYTRKTLTLTEIEHGGEVTRSEISSELLMNDGNASFRRKSADGDEEYFLIDGFLCYGGKFGNYRFGGYNTSSFSRLAGNYFPIDAFEGGTSEYDGDDVVLRFDCLTDSGVAQIAEMLGLPDGYSLTVTNAEFRFVTDTAANMKEKELTVSARITLNGDELISFTLTSRTEQTGINEENDPELPDLTSYTVIADDDCLALYETALSSLSDFLSDNQAFEMTESYTDTISGALSLHIHGKTDYAYAKRIGASIERTFDTGSGTGIHRVLTHFNHHHGFSQINGGNIFVDTTVNADNLAETLNEPFVKALIPFSYAGRIESTSDGGILLTLNTEGKTLIAREILLNAGIIPKALTVTDCTKAEAFITLDGEGRILALGYSFSAHITADGKTYTVSRTHTLDVTKCGSANVKVILIDVEEEEE